MTAERKLDKARSSKAVAVESHVLRYWEDELELTIPRNEMGHRYYTKENIDEFLRIKELKEQGYQLKAIKMILHNQNPADLETEDMSEMKKAVVENPKNIKIQELEAAQVARVTGEVAYVVLNGNYALEAGYSVGKDALAYEKSDSEAAKTYVNVIAVKEGNENNPAIKALVDTLKSDTIKQYINDTYDGAVIPFED